MLCPEPDRWTDLADPARRDALEHHLDECDDCRALVAALTHDDAPAVWAPELAAAGAKIGRYVIERPLGAGGMGVVLAAHDPQLERTVALKLVRVLGRSPDAIARARERLIGEARAMAKLAHPNVVAVYEIVEAGDELVIAMERVDGADLAKWSAVARTRAERMRAIVDAGRGLAAAHVAGIVHRDVKPANILVGSDGRAQLTDLGLAAAIASADREPHAIGTPAGRVGTPGYLAPELEAGSTGDESSDQYAFAVTARQTLGAHASRRVARVLARASAEKASDRYASVATMVDQLERAARRRWPIVLGGTAIATAAIGVAVIAIAWPHTDACKADASVGGVWTAPRRALLAGSLVDTSPERRLAIETRDLVDARANAWAAAAVDTCHARERGTVDEARGSCLEEQRRDLDALLATATGGKAARALAAIAHFAQPSACDHAPRVVDDPDHRRIEDELRKLGALAAVGNYKAARDGVEALANTTTAPDVVAKLAYHRAEWTARAGDPQAALALARAAVALAETSHDDISRVQAMTVLVGTTDELGLTKELDTLAPLLEAAAARQPLPDAKRAGIENVLGNGAVNEGNYEVGVRHYRAAIALIEHEYGGKPAPELAGAMQNLAAALHGEANTVDARATIEKSIAMFEATVGPDHPDLAIALSELATLEIETSHYDRAAEILERVIAIRTNALGADHAYLSEPLELLARVEADRHHDERAIELYRRALSIAVKGFGPTHPMVALIQGKLGDLMGDHGQPGEAKRLLTDSVANWGASGTLLPDAFDAQFSLAKLDYAAGDHAAARKLAEAGRAGYAAMAPPYAKFAAEMAAWLKAHP